MTGRACCRFSREHAHLSAQAGYALVEFMMATAITLFILGGIFTL